GSALKSFGDPLDRLLLAHKHAQAFGKPRGSASERLRSLYSDTYSLALQFGGNGEQRHGSGLKHVAKLLQTLREDDCLIVSGRIGELDDANLAARARAPLGAREHSRGQSAAGSAGAHSLCEIPPPL